MRKGREHITYTCAICGKEKWTCAYNYTENMTCPSCKRSSHVDYKEIGRKAAEARAKNGTDGRGGSKGPRSEEWKAKMQKHWDSPDYWAKKKAKQLANHGGSYHSEEGRKNIGSRSGDLDVREKISASSKERAFNHRNSEKHIEYEKEIIAKRGLTLLETCKDDGDETYFKIKCGQCGEEFEWHLTGDHQRPFCPVCFKAPYSKLEKEIASFIRELGIEPVENDRSVLDGKELDLYFPDRKLAIEVDGLYWHNNQKSEKFGLCKEKGIRLIRIAEPEWRRQPEKVKAFLKSTFGIFEHKIGARKCKLSFLTTKQYEKFTEENHLQGYTSASIRLGLFYGDELVQCMSFSKSRYSKEEYEMTRECSKLGYAILGGKDKLFSFFMKTYQPKSVVSYCEADKFSGSSYLRLGFTLERLTPPGYLYYKDGWESHSRLEFQKSKLDGEGTEWEIMERNGWLRLFDYGQLKFTLIQT